MNNRQDDEINILELLSTLWDGKWKIFGIMFFSFIVIFVIQALLPPPNFTATTKIKPISSIEEEKYKELNEFKYKELNDFINELDEKQKLSEVPKEKVILYEVTKKTLLNMYIRQLQNGKVIEKAIYDSGLLDVNKYKNEQEYKNAIAKFGSSITLIAPEDDLIPNDERDFIRNWRIQHEYNEIVKWKEFLYALNNLTNQAVKELIKKEFTTIIDIKKQDSKFAIEDTKTEIKNTYITYEKLVENNLALLKEQAKIARKLGIEKNTFKQTQPTLELFYQKNGIKSSDNPYYLRGFLAIEKEIDLLETRSNIDPFVIGLLKLKAKKRAIEQNKTIERAESLFTYTPVMLKDSFTASNFNVEATSFKEGVKRDILLAITLLIAFVIGVLYVMFSKSKTNQNHSK